MLNFILLFVAAILAVVLGTKTKVSMGIWAYIFAFLLGIFRANLSASGIVNKIPNAIFFALVSSAMFFGFANSNGTMKVLANRLMWRFRKQAYMAPVIMFIIATVISLCGVNGTTGLVVSSMCFAVAASVNCDVLPVLLVVGAAAGGWGMFPWCSAGAVNFGTISSTLGQDAGYYAAYAGGIIGLIVELITAVIICIKVKAFKKPTDDMVFQMTEKPEYTPEQRKTFNVIIISMLLIVIPTLLNVFFKTPFTKKLTGFLSVQFVWTVGIAVLALMNAGDLKTIITQRVPWNAVILVTGMATLFNLAQPLGVVDVFAKFLQSVPSTLILPAVAVIVGILSFFVSGLVTVPLFVPLAETLAAASGHSPGLVMAAVIAGGLVTSISPVSSGGAYLLSGAPDEKQANRAYSGLFKCAIFNAVLIFVLFFVIQLILH